MVLPHTGANAVPGAAGETSHDDTRRVGWCRRGGAPQRLAYGFTAANLELAMEAIAYARSLGGYR
ncbi:hypothetical protein [Mariniluteicoccus endophyticus]